MQTIIIVKCEFSVECRREKTSMESWRSNIGPKWFWTGKSNSGSGGGKTAERTFRFPSAAEDAVNILSLNELHYYHTKTFTKTHQH